MPRKTKVPVVAYLSAARGPLAVRNRTRPVPSGIPGLDAVLHGGFPLGRTTIVVGGPGGGKTVLATQFLVNGALQFGEPGLMISFEESPAAIKANFPALSWPLDKSVGADVQFIDGRMPEDTVHSGGFDLGGLIAIATALVEKNGVKRIAIDGIDALFALNEDQSNRRREILRILTWLTEMGITALLTIKVGERLGDVPAYFDLAEYAADGVIKLKTTLVGELSRRTFSVVKMRGAGYEAGAHPYIISDLGVRVLHSPTRTAWIAHAQTFDGRLSTGVERLDLMLLGGYRIGTTTLISGTPGASKTTLSASFLAAGCRAGERCLFVGFDEPADQMLVDVRSVGIDLDGAVRTGLLRVESFAAGGVIGDEHYLSIEGLIDEHNPKRVVIDPISALDKAGGRDIADTIRERLVVLFKSRGITAIFTAMADSLDGGDITRTRVSTIADTWIHLGFASRGGERNRTLTVLKSRGTGHSNQVREMLLTSAGIDLADVYTSGGETLSGTARAQKEQQNVADREAAEEIFATALETLDREGQSLARSLKEAQRGLDELAEHRAELVKRSATTGRNRARDLDLIHSLRRGDAEDG
jgi:circadian clock protein KaiC